jgi:exonuclease SbcC
LAYRQPVTLSFEGIDLACLSGANGSGKSSLLDAITWVLWGDSRSHAKSDEVLIHMGQHEMYVSLDFRQDTRLYRVRREFKRGKSNQSALYLFYWDEAAHQFLSLSESLRETQDKINRLLKLDCETFVNSALVRQGQADSFTLKTPGQRKELLVTILGLSRWEAYEKQAKAHAEKLQNGLIGIDAEITRILQEEAAEPRLKDDLADAEQARLDIAAQVEQAQAHYQEVANATEQKRAAEAHLADVERRLREMTVERSRLQQAIERHTQRRDRFRAILSRQGEIEALYAQLEAARHADYEQGEKLRQRSALDAERTAAQRELDAERAKLEKRLGVHQDRIRKEDAALAERPALQARASQLEAEVTRFRALEAECEVRRDEEKQLHGEAEALRAANQSLRLQMDPIKERLDAIQDMTICTLCGQVVDDSHRAHMIEQLTADGRALGNQHRANKQRIDELQGLEAANKTELKQLEKHLKGFDALKAEISKLQERLDSLDQSDERREDERRVAAELEAQLAEGRYGDASRSRVQSITLQIEAVGYDQALHDEARRLLSQLQLAGVDADYRDLQAAIEGAGDVEENLRQAEANFAQKQTQIEDETARQGDAKRDIERLAQLEQEAIRRGDEVRRLRQEEYKANERKIGIEQKLRAIHDSRQRKRDLQQQRDQTQEEIGLYADLREAFGKNGIPAMIIESAIPDLEQTTNRLLARMTDGRMAIRFDTQRTNKSGSTIETLDILISDELGQRNYDLFSGGEGFRINFALRVALSQFLARRAGARLQTLIIDEGFGSQDAVGRERIVEAINAIRGDFDLILIVTHIEELLDLFPARIEVRKTATGSVAVLK